MTPRHLRDWVFFLLGVVAGSLLHVGARGDVPVYTEEPTFQYKVLQGDLWAPPTDRLSTATRLKPTVYLRYANPPSPRSNDAARFTGVAGTSYGVLIRDVSTHVSWNTDAGVLHFGTCLNLTDLADPNVLYGNLNSGLSYQWAHAAMPPPTFEMELIAERPLYRNYGGNPGGSVTANLTLQERAGTRSINLLVVLYSTKPAHIFGIKRYDPNNGALHVTSGPVQGPYVTPLPNTLGVQPMRPDGLSGGLRDIFRFKLTEQDLTALTRDAGYTGTYGLKAIGVHYELNKQGAAIMCGGFSAMQVRSIP